MSDLENYGDDLRMLHGLYPDLLVIDYNMVSQKYEIKFKDQEISNEYLIFIGQVDFEIYWFAVDNGGRTLKMQLKSDIQLGSIFFHNDDKNIISDKCCSKLFLMNITLKEITLTGNNKYDMAAIHRRYVLNNIINE